MHAILRSAFLGFAIAVAATNVSSQSADLGMGTWKLNVEKSKFTPGPAPKSITTRFEAAGQGVKWSAERIGTDGTRTVSEYTASYDGKDYPLKGSSIYDAVALRRIDARTTERLNKKDGKVVNTERREVAKDGKSYVTTVKGKTAKGDTIDTRMVFEKQ